MGALGVQKLRAVGPKPGCSNFGGPGLDVERFLGSFWNSLWQDFGVILGATIDYIFVVCLEAVWDSIWEHFVSIWGRILVMVVVILCLDIYKNKNRIDFRSRFWERFWQPRGTLQGQKP